MRADVGAVESQIHAVEIEIRADCGEACDAIVSHILRAAFPNARAQLRGRFGEFTEAATWGDRASKWLPAGVTSAYVIDGKLPPVIPDGPNLVIDL